MGNGTVSGWTDPGVYATPPATNNVYGHYGLHHYNGNVQDVNQINSVASQNDKKKYGGVFGPLIHVLNGSTEVDSKLSATAKSLRQGVDVRSAPSAPNPVYQAIPHQTLYDSVTKGVNPGAVGDVSQTWLEIGNSLARLQDTVAQKIAGSEVTWTGAAAEGARQSIAKLGNQSGQAGQAAQLAGVLAGQQQEALSSAKNTIPPPPNPPFDPAAAQQQLQTVQDPIAYATQAAADQSKAAAQQAAHQLAAHVVQQYDQTVSQTSASMPAFAPAPPVTKPGGPGAPTMPAPPNGGNPSLGGNPAPRFGSTPGSNNPVRPPRNPGGSTSPWTPPNSGPTSENPPTNGGDPNTHTSGYVPPNTRNPGTDPFGPPETSTGLGDGGPFGVGSAGEFGSGAGFGGSGTGFGGAGSGMAGLGSAASGSGPGGSGAAGGGAGTSGTGGAGTSGTGGQSPTGAAEEALTGARSTSTTPMTGARGQRGQQDKEHKRPSWLLESDEGIFGTSELTAPPVIGE
jgi:hypothetical protein